MNSAMVDNVAMGHKLSDVVAFDVAAISRRHLQQSRQARFRLDGWNVFCFGVEEVTYFCFFCLGDINFG